MQIQRKDRPGRQGTSGDEDHPQKKGPIGVGEAVATVDGKKGSQRGTDICSRVGDLCD